MHCQCLVCGESSLLTSWLSLYPADVGNLSFTWIAIRSLHISYTNRLSRAGRDDISMTDNILKANPMRHVEREAGSRRQRHTYIYNSFTVPYTCP